MYYFFGDSSTNYEFFGEAKYINFILKDTAEWYDALFAMDSLYKHGNMPDSCVGMIHIKNFHLYDQTEKDMKRARVDDGSYLTSEILRSMDYSDRVFGSPISSVYFVWGDKEVLQDKKIALLRCKKLEMQDKNTITMDLWLEQKKKISNLRSKVETSKEQEILRSKLRDRNHRMKEMIRKCYPNIMFHRSSLDNIIRYCSHRDSHWRVLDDLSHDRTIESVNHEIQVVRGARENWRELDLDRDFRLYFLHNRRNDRYCCDILIGKKTQQDEDIRYIKKKHKLNRV